MSDAAETRYPETAEEEAIADSLRTRRGPDLTADVVGRAIQRANIMLRVPTYSTALDLLAMAEDKIQALEAKVVAAEVYATFVAEEQDRDEVVSGAWSLLEELGR